jgi:hypothetical protein
MEISKHIGDLIDRYWQLAYAEGRENRQHDTEAGDAQECRRQIDDAIAALHTDPCEPVAYMHPIGAIWRDDNYPAGMDFTKDGWIPLYASPAPSLGVDIEEVKRQARADAIEEAAKLATTCINPADRCKCSTAYEISAAIRALSKIEGGEDGR